MPMTASVNLPPILNGTNYFPNCDDLNGNFRPRWRRAYSPFLPLSCGPPVTNGHSLRPLGIPEMYATSIPISVEARHRVDPLPTVEPPLFRRDVPIQLDFEANSYLAIREETYSRTEEEVSELTSPSNCTLMRRAIFESFCYLHFCGSLLSNFPIYLMIMLGFKK